MAKTKIYYQLTDLAEVCEVVMTLKDCMDWIKEDVSNANEMDLHEFQYTITPVAMTQKEFNELKDADL